MNQSFHIARRNANGRLTFILSKSSQRSRGAMLHGTRAFSTRLLSDRHHFRDIHRHSLLPFQREYSFKNPPPLIRSTSSLFSTKSANAARPDSLGETTDEDIESAYAELKWVSSELRKHDQIYYENKIEAGVEPIGDDAYDALALREAAICDEHPSLVERWQNESGLGLAATRSGRVGTQTDELEVEASISTNNDRVKRRHVVPMLSLDNVSNDEQLLAWLGRVQKNLLASANECESITILTEPKLDGISLCLRFELDDDATESIQYSLSWASTRGDGRQGQDVTHAVHHMGLPTKISLVDLENNPPPVLEVRGEVVMPRTVFARLKSEAEASIEANEKDNSTSTALISAFSNARNAASGILMRKKETLSKKKNGSDHEAEAKHLRSQLRFYAYDLIVADLEESLVSSAIESRHILERWGFAVPDPIATTKLQIPDSTANEEDSSDVDGGWLLKDIPEMMKYHTELQKNRESQANDLVENSTSTVKPKSKKRAPAFRWGDYDMDGCVHKISDFSQRSFLGASNRSPRWAIAHKFPPITVMTYLEGVEVQIGRTGVLTPVAVLEPTDIGGVCVQRATLHNFKHLQELLLGSESTSETMQVPFRTPVLVRRAGEVIPQVVQRLSSTPTNNLSGDTKFISLDPPIFCPACGSPTVLDEASKVPKKDANSTASTPGQKLRCSGPPLQCPPRAVVSLGHAFSRDALDVTGLSASRIQQLKDADMMRYPSDIFTWDDEQWEEIAQIPGWGKKSCANLRAAVGKVASEGVTLGRFIYSLGIRQLGQHTSALVAETYGSADAFLNAVEAAANWNDIVDEDDEGVGETEHPFSLLLDDETKGVGTVIVSFLVLFSKEKDSVEAARKLANSIHIIEDQKTTDTAAGGKDSDRSLPFKGKKVVFTGSIENMTRSQAQSYAKILGASSTPGSISKSTDIVVHGAKGGGKKLDKASDLGIRLMDADEFIALLSKVGVTDAT